MLATLAVAATLALAAPAPAPQEPPVETLDRAQAALDLLDGRGFVGSYLMTVHVDVVASGEDGPEDTLEVKEITIAEDGTRTSRLIRAVEDGRDVTSRRLASEGEVEEEHASRSDHAGFDTDLLPLGRNTRNYTFSHTKVTGGVATSEFRPRRGVEEDEMGRGTLAWDVASGDPLWIDAEMAKHHVGVKELTLRFEFARDRDVLYPRAIRSRTRAGIPLLFKLHLELDLELSELRPAATDAAI
jgi:hypothetical protein